MGNRVMFIDDDERLLASVRRQLMMRLSGCELLFCSSAKEALLAVQEKAPVAVVSDVRMPVIDGPTLLRAIGKDHPDTIRFALTGQSTVQQLEQAYAVTHQVFTKPYPAEKIGDTILQAMQFRSALDQCPYRSRLTSINNSSMNLRRASEVIQLLDNPETTTEELCSCIESDGAARTRLLSISNSAFFSPAKPITTVAGAVVLLGFAFVKAIYLACQLLQATENSVSFEKETQACFEKGVAVGVQVQRIARLKKSTPHHRDSAMIAALFHQYGRVQVASVASEALKEFKLACRSNANTDSITISQIENQHFGASLGKIAAYVLFIHGLDAAICEAIAGQHSEPSDETEPIKALLYEAIQTGQSINEA